MCSDTTNEILQRHVLFASLMAQRIDDASKSQYNLKYDGPETTKLAKDISKASRSLSTNVTQMTNDLTAGFGARRIGDASHWPRARLTHPCTLAHPFD